MLKRLLKHELITNFKLMRIICAIIIGLGVLGGLASLTKIPFLIVISLLGLTLAIEAVTVLEIVQIFQIMIRNTFDKRGYITFQIPVTSHQIILSKLLSIIISVLIICASIFVSFLILAIFSGFNFNLLLSGIAEVVSFIFTMEGFELILLGLSSFIMQITILFYCLAYSNTGGSKGRKIVSSILLYFGIMYVLNIILLYLSHGILWIIVLIYSGLTVLFYFLSVNILNIKLELQ